MSCIKKSLKSQKVADVVKFCGESFIPMNAHSLDGFVHQITLLDPVWSQEKAVVIYCLDMVDMDRDRCHSKKIAKTYNKKFRV